MESEYQHKILVVEDDKNIVKLLDDFSKKKQITPIFVNNGDAALEEIKNAEISFSVIIANQSLDSMTGTKVLEHARETIPNTIRVLMTSQSEVDTVINAVNKGAIQNFIIKPWTENNLDKVINSSIKLYNKFLEDSKLLQLAKKQSIKLYDRGCECMEITKSHKKKIEELDNTIKLIKNEIKTLSSKTTDNSDTTTKKIIDEIHIHIVSEDIADQKKINTLFSDTLRDLYNQFNDIAYGNGFEMPDIKGEIK